MTVVYPLVGRPAVQEAMPDEQIHRREIARSVNQLMAGHSNATLTVTLDPGVATTSVVDPRISTQTAAVLVPLTATAAAAIPTTWVTPTKGVVVIHHTSSAVADRTFQMLLAG